MTNYAGIDVSLETSSVCIVDAQGAIQREFKTASEPDAMVAALLGTGLPFARIGFEAGPLSQWLHAGLAKAGLPVVLLETRQLRATTKAMPVKTDRNDARAMAQVVRTALDGLLTVVLAGSGWIGFCRSMVPGGPCEVQLIPGDAHPAQRPQAAGGQAA